MVENSYPVSRKCTEKIIKQMNNSFYKLNIREKKFGICYFCKIKFKDKEIPVLLITYPVSNIKYLANKNEIKIRKNNGEQINIKFGKTFYINIDFSIILIEIEENKQIEFLDIDDILYEKEPEIFFSKQTIYIIHYDKNKKDNFVSYGKINYIKNNELIFSCGMSYIYSNSAPIFNQSNNKIIGIFKNDCENKNRGILFKYIIKEFIKEYRNPNKRLKYSQNFRNEIKIFFEIKEEEINKDIYFLDRYDNLKELNLSKIDIYLNNNLIQKEDKKNFFKACEEGNFCIKLIFYGYLTDSSYMFSGCEQITEINFISFNTNYITNMEYMFYKCTNLKKIINLLSFDTKNVLNMRYMFYHCSNLINFELFSFNTNQVVNMSNMFNGCKNLKYINLSFFNTKNVVDMSNMFNGCKNLIGINLSSFDIKNVIDMRYMFNDCINLKNLVLTSFDTRNTIETSYMFLGCTKLDNLDSLIHNVKNISNNDYKIYQEYLIKKNISADFEENPKELKFKYDLVNNGLTTNSIINFEVFIGLKDKIEYIVYQNQNDKNLNIMRIIDKIIITTLKVGKIITIIKYYMKNINEDYLLSSYSTNLINIWDIQKNYSLKYKLEPRYIENIHHAILLFNINNKDYMLLSTTSKDNYERSKLYKFEDGTPFDKDIYNSNKNRTNYMISWLYNKKYYIIGLCDGCISINNIFEDENYAHLSKEPEGKHRSGFIYKENNLCVNDSTKSNIRIWDLINKTIIKEITYPVLYGLETISWNDKYAIVGCKDFFVIINIEQKEVSNIEVKDGQVFGIKKIKINKYGECLIASVSRQFFAIGVNYIDLKLFGF